MIFSLGHFGFASRKDSSLSAGMFSVVLDKNSQSTTVLSKGSFERRAVDCANSQSRFATASSDASKSWESSRSVKTVVSGSLRAT